jgi:hypothetical protein
MAYQKQNWTSVTPGGTPPPGATNNIAGALNTLEQGVANAAATADQAKALAENAIQTDQAVQITNVSLSGTPANGSYTMVINGFSVVHTVVNGVLGGRHGDASGHRRE